MLIRTTSKDVIDFIKQRNSKIIIENNCRYISMESEKNRKCDYTTVNQNLRKIITSLWRSNTPLFHVIHVETCSGCNSSCSFCPVNKYLDPRKKGFMDMDIINRIASELKELHYDKTILLYGNNEPLLDNRIVSIVELFRKLCPKSYIKLLTNGIELNKKLAMELFKAGLSTLSINNYCDNQLLIPPIIELIKYDEELSKYDIRITIRNIDEILTTRAGQAPNKEHLLKPLTLFCSLPFVDLFVDYLGNYHICCFDALGMITIGSVYRDSLYKIWHGKELSIIRKKLLDEKRNLIKTCSFCDFDGFRDPFQDKDKPIVRDDLINYEEDLYE